MDMGLDSEFIVREPETIMSGREYDMELEDIVSEPGIYSFDFIDSLRPNPNFCLSQFGLLGIRYLELFHDFTWTLTSDLGSAILNKSFL